MPHMTITLKKITVDITKNTRIQNKTERESQGPIILNSTPNLEEIKKNGTED